MSGSNLINVLVGLGRIPRALARRAEERRHRKLMRRAPRFEIATMPENTFGKLVGVVRPSRQRLIEAPFSGRLCVYYEASLDLMDGSALVRTLVTEQEGIPFVLADAAGGRAFVDPAHAFLSTEIDHVAQATRALCPDRARALIARHPRLERKLLPDDELRFREAILEVDERIAVFGGGVREPDPDADPASYREGAATRLCLGGSERFPLFLSDDRRVL